MRVLWITNILFPEVEQIITGTGELRATGGWMLGAADALLENKEVKLFVATVSSKVKALTKCEGKEIIYYVIPYGKGNSRINEEYIPYWKNIKEQVNPDVVHIHGSEYTHGYSYIMACGNNNVVVSIQGLVSAYAPYYNYGLSFKDILFNLTFRDFVKGNLIKGQRDFYRRGEYEKLLLKNVKHIIGRTSWDQARTWAINPNAEYHFCNETLRAEFYDGSKWDYSKCVKHSIFLSQAGYPIKGLHQVLKAMPIVLLHYPNAVLRVAGADITKTTTLKDKLRLLGYGKYVKRLIKKYHLEGKVMFIGNLNAEQMKHEYLKSNIFICPSSIENSPNSLAEAQILGVPCLASYVGGIMDMMEGAEQYMYRFEETEMLAFKICCLFAQENCAQLVDKAISRHDSIVNAKQLVSIYNKILR